MGQNNKSPQTTGNMRITYSLLVLLTLKSSFAFLPGTRLPKRCGVLLEGATRREVQDLAAKAIGGLALTFGIVMSNPILPLDGFTPMYVASAKVAPLVDVGLREFLVKDGQQFLRLNLPTSLPTSSNPEELGDIGRAAQESIELVRLRLEQVGFSGKTPIWNASLKDAQKAQAMLDVYDIYKNIPLSSLDQAKEFISRAKGKAVILEDAIRRQDISTTLQLQEEVGKLIYEIRLLSLKPDTLPYELPEEVASAAQLRGLAVAEIVILKSNGSFDLGDGVKANEATLTVTLDGYHAPITTGNFVDLIERKFYDGLKITTADELIVQTGDPTGTQQTSNGFIDPSTLKTRTIPLEIFYKNDKAPTYSYTSDDDQRSTEAFSNPFQSYGAIGMAHDPEDVNTASSQFFFLKWDQNMVAPGKNTLDGSQTCFGYMTDGQDSLRQVKKGDTIATIRIVDGLENFHATRTP